MPCSTFFSRRRVHMKLRRNWLSAVKLCLRVVHMVLSRVKAFSTLVASALVRVAVALA